MNSFGSNMFGFSNNSSNGKNVFMPDKLDSSTNNNNPYYNSFGFNNVSNPILKEPNFGINYSPIGNDPNAEKYQNIPNGYTLFPNQYTSYNEKSYEPINRGYSNTQRIMNHDPNSDFVAGYSKGYSNGYDSGFMNGYTKGLAYINDVITQLHGSPVASSLPNLGSDHTVPNCQSHNLNSNINYTPYSTPYSIHNPITSSLSPIHNPIISSPIPGPRHSPKLNLNPSNEYTSGYDCGIKNYINAVNLINAYNPHNNTSSNTTNLNENTINSSNKTKKKQKEKFNIHTRKKKKHNNYEQQSNNTNKNNQQNNTPDLNIDSNGNKKPIIIIRKITKENNNEENSDFGSMLNNLFCNEDSKKEKDTVNYLEDSDDENDNLVTIDELKCDEEFKNKKKEQYSNTKIVLLNEIIKKNNISSVDDLITIGNYYEENFLSIKKSDNSNDENNKDNETIDYNENDDGEEFKIMETIMKNLGIPITPRTNIIINNKTKKKILTSPKKTDNPQSNEKEEKKEENNNGKNNEDNTVELYKIGEFYFTINLEKVYKMKGHLIKLKKMIGLDNIKNEIIDMVLYYLMEFEKSNNNMLHMTLEGSPGCGKTKLAKIISKLLGAMGILDNNKVVYARRTDMIGQYLGQTGQKTQQVINSALGGVLFIDEAYSLGNSKKDIYSKECLDILNQNLSDNKKKFVCIIAGYPEELENYFFSSNPGLTRRFPFRFKITDYNHSELLNIFINKINKLNWKLDKYVNLEEFFEKNISHFKFFGGDIDTLIQDIKYSHSRRVVCSHPSEFLIITKTDIKTAFDKFKNRRNNSGSDVWKNMFV